MDAANPWRPIGTLLVEQGVLTEAELETALAEQQRTGRKLGEIIVEQGFASSPAVTRALAAQSGLDVPAEGGFGSGLWSEIERRHKERRDRETESRPPREHLIIEFPGGTVHDVEPANAPQEAVATAHLLFVPSPAGYELVEREGAPPATGDEVELEDGRVLVVAKVARAPLPGDGRPCAYLESARVKS